MERFLEAKGISSLYDWQKECLKLRPPITEYKNLVYSLPTSAGKSLVAEVHLMRHLLEGNSVMMVLPFVSIVQEKVSAWNEIMHYGMNCVVEEYAAGKGNIPPIKRRRDNKGCLFIATIEKAGQLVAAAINGKGPWITCCVIDELHMLGEGIRGARLESLISKLNYAAKQKQKICQVIGMSATLPNLPEVAKFMKAELFESDYRPVPLTEYIKTGSYIHKICRSLPSKTKYDRSIPVTDPIGDKDSLYQLTKEIIDLNKTLADKKGILMFCPTRKQCENCCVLLAKKIQLFNPSVETSEIDGRRKLLRKIESELKDVGGIRKELFGSIIFGVAFHHAGLTQIERQQIEEGFRDGFITVLCCTSTLAAGVNLPARRVIIRSIKQGKGLLDPATYRQMAGRAGRKGFDSEGECIVIVEPKLKNAALKLIIGDVQPALSRLDLMLEEVILSVLALHLTLTKRELHEFLSEYTFRGIQKDKQSGEYTELIDKKLIDLESLAVVEKKEAEVDGVPIIGEIDIRVTRLGVACVESNSIPSECRILRNKLEHARKGLNLENALHLISLRIKMKTIFCSVKHNCFKLFYLS